MKTQLDYIVVGLGLAGINFCELLFKNNKSFVVYDTGENFSSAVSGGLYNPVILKRLTLSWNAADQLKVALPVYEKIEERLGAKFDQKLAVRKKFQSVEDQNNWVYGCDKPHLKQYLNPEIIMSDDRFLKVPFGMGEVLNTGRINTAALIKAYRDFLSKNQQLLLESFKYDRLIINDSRVNYQDASAKHIVFAEGFGLKKNPFFNSDPLKGNKGELLLIKAPKLKLDFVLKTDVFITPLSDDMYWVGATYNWKDKDLDPTQQAREKLILALEKLIDCDYEVVDHKVGMRPTTVDRRPLVGVHKEHPQLAVLNGLGTRGVMIGPTVARQLFEHLESGVPIPKEVDIRRFDRT